MVLVASLAIEPAVAESSFQPPWTVPATPSEHALAAPLNALAVAGPRLIAAGQRGHILYSRSGTAWSQATVPVSSDLTALSFPNAEQGWAVGHSGVVLHTADGGASWAKQLDGDQIAKLLIARYGKPANPQDPDEQRLARDAELAATQGADKPLLDVWFADEKRGFAIGAFNLILHTEDGGQSWTPWSDRIENPKDSHLYAIRPAGSALFIVGEQGLVLKLDPDKQRFVSVPLPYQGTLFGVVGTERVVLVFGLRGNVWRSTDGGANWSKVETGVTSGMSSGIVRNDGSIVLASQAGEVLLSTDNGATFHRTRVGRAAPTFAMADAGHGDVALAGMGGVRIEATH